VEKRSASTDGADVELARLLLAMCLSVVQLRAQAIAPRQA
jgi:hypothetical protein